MTKVFVSQPMKGKTNREIERERKEIIEKAEKRFGGIEVIDSFFKDAPPRCQAIVVFGEIVGVAVKRRCDCPWKRMGKRQRLQNRA